MKWQQHPYFPIQTSSDGTQSLARVLGRCWRIGLWLDNKRHEHKRLKLKKCDLHPGMVGSVDVDPNPAELGDFVEGGGGCMAAHGSLCCGGGCGGGAVDAAGAPQGSLSSCFGGAAGMPHGSRADEAAVRWGGGGWTAAAAAAAAGLPKFISTKSNRSLDGFVSLTFLSSSLQNSAVKQHKT